MSICDVAGRRCAAGNLGRVDQGCSHDAIGIDEFIGFPHDRRRGKDIDRNGKSGATAAGIHTARIGFDENIATIKSRDARTVNVDRAQSHDVYIAAA